MQSSRLPTALQRQMAWSNGSNCGVLFAADGDTGPVAQAAGEQWISTHPFRERHIFQPSDFRGGDIVRRATSMWGSPARRPDYDDLLILRVSRADFLGPNLAQQAMRGDWQSISNHQHTDRVTRPVLVVADVSTRRAFQADVDLWYRLTHSSFGERYVDGVEPDLETPVNWDAPLTL